MDLYAENILDHYRHPRGKCKIENVKCKITHKESNPACGDEITIGLTIEDGKIKNIGWQGTGCAISQAAMSMLFEELEGKSLEDINKLSKDDVLEMLGVPVSARRMNCALLCLHAVKKALT